MRVLLLISLLSSSSLIAQDSLFYGVFNQVKLSGLSTKEVQVSVANGVAETDPKDASIIWIRPASLEKASLMIRKDGRAVLQKQFFIRNLGDPIAVVANIRSNTASVEDIVANPFIRAVIPNAVLRNAFRIRAFTFLIKKTNGSVISFDRTFGHQLDTQQLAAIRKCKKSDQLVFEEITCSIGDSNDQRAMHPVILRIR